VHVFYNIYIYGFQFAADEDVMFTLTWRIPNAYYCTPIVDTMIYNNITHYIYASRINYQMIMMFYNMQLQMRFKRYYMVLLAF